jgi:hypothetical protein
MNEILVISNLLGQRLEAAMDALPTKEYSIHGGGLRHGAPEWQVDYYFNGLRRLLIFNVDYGVLGDLNLRVHVAAVEEGSGRRAQRGVGMTVLRRQSASEMLSQNFVTSWVNQARESVNEIKVKDLREFPMQWQVVGAGAETEKPGPPT